MNSERARAACEPHDEILSETNIEHIITNTLFQDGQPRILKIQFTKTNKRLLLEMDLQKLNSNLQNLKEKLRNLVAVSADLIEYNSQIDNGGRCDNVPSIPRFELLLEDFLSTCNMIELNLRTMQECLALSKASIQNLPVSMSPLKCDNLDNRVELIEPNGTVSYNQYLSIIRYQVDTAKAIRGILEDFVIKQNQLQKQQQQQHQQHQQQLQNQHPVIRDM